MNLYIYCYNNPVSKTKLISRTLTTTSPYSNAINLTPSFNIASLTISTINNNFIKIINENLRNIVDNLKIKKIIEIFTYVLNIEKSIITGFPIKFFAEKVKVKKSHIKKEEHKIENFVKEIVSNVDPESTADFTNNCISMMADEYSSNSYPLQPVGAGGYGDPNGFYGWCGGCFSYKCDDDLIDILLSMNMW